MTLTAAEHATAAQNQAADPGDHVWVSANAGSGKTRVLITRVARLLLDEVPPQNVLCLTYTKAAASEMQNRLFDRLGSWAMRPDDELAEELGKLGVEDGLDHDRLTRARRLFARAIETPGGLRIQTIHAFCASLLRRFPLEARVSPQFQEMDDRAGALIREEIMDDLARTRPDLVDPVAARHNGVDFDRFLAQVTRTDAFARPADEAALARALGLPVDWDDELPLRLTWQGGERVFAGELREAFSGTSKTYETFADELVAVDHDNPDWTGFDTLCGLFLYAADKTSKSRNFPQSRHRKAVEAIAHLIDELHDWMDRVADARAMRSTIEVYRHSLALHRFGHAFHTLYAARKERDARLDFDDLITRALALLTDGAVAQWVLFKLDGGIDHILVDEAQDTSPDQWEVIRRLTEEFATGYGARSGTRRTLFVVGDKKQSIYSFQGADPEAFDRMRDHFDSRFAEVEDRLETVPLLQSFRSAPAILTAVDATFVGDAADGVEDDIRHTAFKAAMPGRVDLWPVQEKDGGKVEAPDWHTPLDRAAPDNPNVVLAERIARRIREMIDTGVTIPVEDPDTKEPRARPVTEGDFLILVRRRQSIFPHVIRACKAAGLNIAGADRLKVGGELAVKDLAALLRFLALPEDDLSLAEALRSPLFGWDEQALFTLAHHRSEGASLWEALRAGAETHAATLAILRDLREQADYLRPFDLIDRVLNRWDGRRRLLARLGEEAEDGIDALLSQALAYEQNAVPSLTGFVGWMQSDDVEIKRQVEAGGDKLRVMTVHGAKGLEAPIVILPDCARPTWIERDEIIPLDGHPVWKPVAAAMPPTLAEVIEARKAAARREWRRLLYVAMTRAESWLMVCAAGEAGNEGESWYRLVEASLSRLDCHEVDTPTGPGRRLETGLWDRMPPAKATRAEVATPIDLPRFEPVEHMPRAATLSPSELGGAKVLPGEPAEGADGEAARSRGTVLHRLLEHLPGVTPADRQRVAAQIVSAAREDFPVADADALIGDALRILEADDLRHLFEGDALAEATLSAPLRGRVFHGAIDRLLPGPGRVLAVDYKSNRIVPGRPEDVPEGILRQMGAYRAMLEAVWPDRTVEVAILWTGAARLMPLPDALVTTAFDRAPLP